MALPISFKSVEVIPLARYPAKILVRWLTTLSGADLADYQFFIERGEASESEPGFQHKTEYGTPEEPPTPAVHTRNFQPVSLAIDGLDNQFYVDLSPEMLNLNKTLFYRVRARKKSTQEDLVSYEVNTGGQIDLVGLYIAEEVNFELSDATGSPSLVYNRKRGGVLCSCVDPIQKKRTASHCLKCYGTNWVGGFYDPIDAYVDYTPNPRNALITQWGETQENQTRVMLANFPTVYPGDVIRELRPNRLWRVGSRVNVTEKHRVTLLQFPEVVEIKPGDIEYQIPIDEEFMLKKIEEFEKTKKRREF
jgi:hypothetical protein